MISHRCRECTWWDCQHAGVKLIPIVLGKGIVGFCRKHKPGAIQIEKHYFGVQPVMDSEEFCGELREEK